jgi:hypothetical protein
MTRLFSPLSRLSKLIGCVAGLLLLAGLSACRTPSLPLVDFSASGWRLLQGQALWKPDKNGLELAGELLVAVHRDGHSFVQFAKTPFTFVEAQRQAGRWQIEFPSRRIHLAGRGQPPVRFPWMHLASVMNHQALPAAWQVEYSADGGWRMEHRRTGETLQVFLGP